MIVLWITILLAAIAVGMSQDSRTQTLLTRNQLALAKARALADGAVERAMYEHLRPPYPDKVWFPNGAVHGWEEDGARLAVSLAYESGRIDVNVAREPLLKGLFTSAAGLEPEAVNRVVDAVMDWRDPDDAKRINGAEAADYRAAGRNYVPANANFETIEELQRVLGMTPEIYAKVADLITVHSRQPGIDPAGASREVLLAIPNMTPDVVDAYIVQRELARLNSQPTPPLPQAIGYTSIGATGFHVNATVRMPDSEVFVREVVVQPTGNPKRPLHYLAWREGMPLEYPQAAITSQAANPANPGLPAQGKP
ncbi:MAG: general secretion pathway protein GspK [Betaproteobacteria bacterium]|nr:general secretion pathway protein GspK [Betaproteobacteria bacterium]